MSRLLAILVLFLLFWLVLQRLRAILLSSPRGAELRALWRVLRQASSAPRSGTREGSARSSAATHPIQLVRCSVCGTHVPEDKARRTAAGDYHCEACEHRAAR